MKKIFTLVIFIISITASCTFAANGLDINEDGFGPIIKGFQLGKRVTFEEAYEPLTDFDYPAIIFQIYDDRNYEKEGSNRRYIRITSSQHSEETDKLKFDFDGTNDFPNQKTIDFLRSISIMNKYYYRPTTLDEFYTSIQRVEKEIQQFPKIIATLPSNYDYNGSVNSFTYIKLSNEPYRFMRIFLPKSAFGAENMPLKDFAQAILDNYQLGQLVFQDRTYVTDESSNAKNGWSLTVDKDGIELNVSNVVGQTSFD